MLECLGIVLKGSLLPQTMAQLESNPVQITTTQPNKIAKYLIQPQPFIQTMPLSSFPNQMLPHFNPHTPYIPPPFNPNTYFQG